MTETARTRLAPSPTGALHLGNARTFLVNWALARQLGWKILLRIDDLDGPRVKKGADRQAIEILEWLGCDWDEGPVYQTHRMSDYRSALESLVRNQEIYPCCCSRSDIMSAQSAPNAGDHELRYPGTCRERQQAVSADRLDDPTLSWRLKVDDTERTFHDQFVGAYKVNVQQQVGDFAVATKSCIPSYQLAVVLDDHDQAITHIVRGDDLLTSTARQAHVAGALGVDFAFQYWHLPLVLGKDGRRLAKRHGDTRIESYRKTGVAPQRVLGLIAEWCGLGNRTEISHEEFVERFCIDQMPKSSITFHAEDDAWLRSR